MLAFFYKLSAGLAHGLAPLWLCAHNAGLGVGDVAHINEYLKARQIVAAAEARDKRGE